MPGLMTRKRAAAPVADLFDEMERRFNELAPGRWFGRTMPEIWPESARLLSFPVDVIDENDEIVVRAQLPGIDKADIEVTATDDMLTIHAERKTETKEEKKNFFRREVRVGSFDRTIPLPAAVKEDLVTASLKNGELLIRAPKQEESTRDVGTRVRIA